MHDMLSRWVHALNYGRHCTPLCTAVSERSLQQAAAAAAAARAAAR